jgi:hypothetical protein
MERGKKEDRRGWWIASLKRAFAQTAIDLYEGSYRTTCRARSFFARISWLEVILADPGSRGERRRGEPGDPKLFPNLYITESNNYDCSYNCILTSTVHSTFAAGYTYARILVSNQCCFLVFAVSPFWLHILQTDSFPTKMTRLFSLQPFEHIFYHFPWLNSHTTLFWQWLRGFFAVPVRRTHKMRTWHQYTFKLSTQWGIAIYSNEWLLALIIRYLPLII